MAPSLLPLPLSTLEDDRGDNKEGRREEEEDDGDGEEGTGGRGLTLESFPDESKSGGDPVGLGRVLSGLANGEDGAAGGGEEVVDLFVNSDPSSTDRIGEEGEGEGERGEEEGEEGDPLKE